MTATPTTATTQDETGGLPAHASVAIIGAGFGGLGMAIRLREEGVEDFVVLERDTDVGGTWWANTYPGCQCDIPSHLYSFSFAPNPDWTRTYPKQPELRDYLRRTAERFGVYEKVRLGCRVDAAAWDEDAGLWRLDTTDGALTADVVVAAPGPLSEPSIPDLPGLDTFPGPTFHTARWDAGVDLRGKRVAVVGTGASAIQVVPEIQPDVEHLDVFQRTPPWVVPHRDRPITGVERRLYRAVPALQRLARGFVYWSRELLVPGLTRNPRLMQLPERLARRHIATQVADPELRRKVTPDYEIGCKRILPSNKWYPALSQPNVDLVTGSIAEVRPEGLVTDDGVLHEADVIIFATGFYVTDIPLAKLVRGRGGRLLADRWEGSPQAYRGTTIAGYPNMFFLVGPNTGLGHNSIVYMIESQLAYVLDALRTMRREGAATLEVRPEAQEQFNASIQRRMPPTVWSRGGCSSWYIDAQGRNTTIWPDFTWRFRHRLRSFDPQAYVMTPAAGSPGHVPEAAAAA
jgi:cation diffusion facilitator CzcD-associated flavoprotein CzcO